MFYTLHLYTNNTLYNCTNLYTVFVYITVILLLHLCTVSVYMNKYTVYTSHLCIYKLYTLYVCYIRCLRMLHTLYTYVTYAVYVCYIRCMRIYYSLLLISVDKLYNVHHVSIFFSKSIWCKCIYKICKHCIYVYLIFMLRVYTQYL